MEFDLRRYVRLVIDWWWLLVIGAIVPAVISYTFVSREPDVYQARTILMVGTTLQSANPNANEMGMAQNLATGYAEMVRYRPVTNQVIEQLGLERSPEALAAQISSSVLPQASLIEIYVTDTDPQAAAAIANAVAEALISQTPAARTQGEQQRFVERQLSDLKAKIEKIETDIERQTAELSALTSAVEIQAAEQNLSSLESVVSRYRSEYAAYLRSYVGESINQLRVVEPATVPARPKGGQKMLIPGVASAVGVGLALAGVFLMEYLDDTVKWQDVHNETLLGLPVLGGLDLMAADSRAMLDRPNERSSGAESLRALRGNILLSRLRHPFDIILFTSAGSQDGKTFVTANLGVSLAAAGRRVVLVDGDMRRPTLHERFDLPNVFGLADLLDDTVQPPDAYPATGLQETGQSNLWLLSAGRPPLDPLTALMSSRLPGLVGSLQEFADIVIFDAPPITAVSDATVLASHCDVVVLVVAHGVTSRGQIETMGKILADHPELDVLGIVFNQVRPQKSGSYYHYYAGRASSPAPLGRLWGSLRSLWVRERRRPDDPDRLVSLSQVAEELGVSRTVARRWCATGRLPAVRQGVQYFVRQRDLETLIQLEKPVRSQWPSSVAEAGEGDALGDAQSAEPETVSSGPWREGE